MNLYYAHAIVVYGTIDERNELAQIKRKFKNARIVNPASYQGEPDSNTMEFYYHLIDGCDKLVFTRLLGKITSGVGLEINYALGSGKSVHELDGKKFMSVTKSVEFITRGQTVALYDEYRRLAMRKPRMFEKLRSRLISRP